MKLGLPSKSTLMAFKGRIVFKVILSCHLAVHACFYFGAVAVYCHYTLGC